MKKLTLALMLAFAACAIPTASHAGFWSGIPIIGGIIDTGISVVGSIFGGSSTAAPAEEAA